MIVDAPTPWIKSFFNKKFFTGLEQVQDKPNEVITAYCKNPSNFELNGKKIYATNSTKDKETNIARPIL